MITFKNPKILDCFIGNIIDAAASHINLAAGAWFNSQEADDAQDFERKEAVANRQWQEEMYNKRYRRTMTDMRKAGLNPILAATGGFDVGSVPGGAMARGHAGTFPNNNYSYSSSAKSLAEADKAESEVSLNKEKVKQAMADTALKREQAGLMDTQEKKVWQEFVNAEKEFEQIDRKVDLLDQEIQLVEKDRERLAVLVDTMRKSLERLSKIADVYRGPAGDWIGYLNAIFGTLNLGGAATAGAVMRR
jgi:hypothetical protein